MNKGFIAFLLGLIVSFLFGFVFMYIQTPSKETTTTIYYLQTGVYQTHENAIKMETQVQELALNSYIYQKDELYYVICTITSQTSEIDDARNVLDHNGINYVQKEVDLELEKNDEQMVDKVLEGLTS